MKGSAGAIWQSSGLHTRPSLKAHTRAMWKLGRPWWMVSLLVGGPTGLAWTAYLVATEGRTLQAVLFGVAFVVFGAVFGRLRASQERRLIGDVGLLPAEQRREILRAVNGGPLPDNETQLDAARALGGRQYEQAKLERFGGLLLLAGFTLLSLYLAVTSDWRWLLRCIICPLLSFEVWWSTKRLSRRLQALHAHPVQPSSELPATRGGLG